MLVGGWYVRMGSKDCGNFAVKIPTHCLLLGCGFGVHVDDDHLHVCGNFRALAIRSAKRIIKRSHKSTALKIHHCIADAALGFSYIESRPGQAIRKIRGTEQTRLVREKV